MALKFADRVKETSVTTGTVTLSLDGTIVGSQTFSAGIGTGNTCYYAISNISANEWEVGLGTFTSGTPDTLSRDTVFSSSTGAKVSFTAGTKEVFVVQPATDIEDLLRGSNNLSDVASAVTAFTNIKQVATTTTTGVVEKATAAEAKSGEADKYPDASAIKAERDEVYSITAHKATTHNFSSDADYTLTATQETYGRIILTDTTPVLTAARSVIVSTDERPYVIQNDTAQALTVKTSAGTGVAVAAGSVGLVQCDGANVITQLPQKKLTTAFLDTTDQSIPSGVSTAIQFTHEYVDDLSGWASGDPTRVYIPQGVSKVIVTASAGFGDPVSDGTQRLMFVKKNGENFAGRPAQRVPPVGAIAYCNAVSSVVDVQGGDYFELMCSHDASTSLEIVGSDATIYPANITWMSIEVIE